MSTSLKSLDNLYTRTTKLLDITNRWSAVQKTQLCATLDHIIELAEQDNPDSVEIANIAEVVADFEDVKEIIKSIEIRRLERQRAEIRECSK